MLLHVTSLYAAALGALLLYLSINVIKARRAARVSVGDGGDDALLRAIRAQGNFAEYTPLGLILIALIEANGFPVWVVHGLGALLVLGRGLHAVGLAPGDKRMKFRVRGMEMTFAVIALGVLINLGGFVWALVR
jgi:hypothetical protein